MANVDLNRPRFLALSYEACGSKHERFNIGTYKEKMLHRVLKDYFAADTACQEIPVAGFIADICSADGIIEIQTSGFASMKDKLEAFLPLGPLTLVYPIARTKWISWIDPQTTSIGKRSRSPKKGKAFDVVPEMIFIRQFLTHPNLTVRAVLLEIDEYRMLDGRRSRSRKRGSTRYERMPIDLCEIYDFNTAEDFVSLLPFAPGEVFTARQLCDTLKYRGRAESAVIRVLMEVGAIVRIGKEKNAYLYRVVSEEEMHGSTKENI